jgi:membrane-bound inhibitor of C-type lysozyme
MPGRLHQASNRAKALMNRRKGSLAEMVANGSAIHAAGKYLGWSKGETARTWSNIKADLGAQAR